MARLRLIHWAPADARPRAAFLRRAGHTVDAAAFDAASLTALRRRQPDAIVIDLTRQPMQG